MNTRDIEFTGDNGTAYIGGFIRGSSFTAVVDVATWTTKWSIAGFPGWPVMALEGGGLAFWYQPTATLTLVDGNGNITSTRMPIGIPQSILVLGEWLGTDIETRALTAIVGPEVNAAMFSFQRGLPRSEGNPQGQNAPKVQVTITINTFIPEEWVDNPAEWLTRGSTWFTTIFEGDNRGFDINGSSRSKQRVAVTPLGLAGPSQTVAGWTRLYDKETSVDADGRLTAEARADTVVGDDEMLLVVDRSADQATAVATRLPDGKVRVTLRYNGNNPLINLGSLNDISYAISLTMDFSGMTYQLTGEHDGFPNYEIYVNRQRIHYFEHDPSPLAPLALGGDMEIDFDQPAAEIQR